MDDDPLNELCVQLLKLLCQKQTLNASPSLPYNFIVYFYPPGVLFAPPLPQILQKTPPTSHKSIRNNLDTLIYKILFRIFWILIQISVKTTLQTTTFYPPSPQIVDLISIF